MNRISEFCLVTKKTNEASQHTRFCYFHVFVRSYDTILFCGGWFFHNVLTQTPTKTSAYITRDTPARTSRGIFPGGSDLELTDSSHQLSQSCQERRSESIHDSFMQFQNRSQWFVASLYRFLLALHSSFRLGIKQASKELNRKCGGVDCSMELQNRPQYFHQSAFVRVVQQHGLIRAIQILRLLSDAWIILGRRNIPQGLFKQRQSQT